MPSERIREIRTRECGILSVRESDKLAGKFLTDDDYEYLIKEEDCDVYKPDGSLLFRFRTGILTRSYCDVAYPNIHEAARLTSGNRGLAGGDVDPDRLTYDQVIKKGKGVRFTPVKSDGTKSNSNYSNPIPSGIIGYYDRHPRFPYCRQTAFNLNKPKQFAKAMPFIREVNYHFRKLCPERWQAQMDIVKATSQDFIIHGTAFTTITVNKNWITATHKDVGDLQQGFGAMSVLRGGTYTGGYLVFPRYRVAVDMSTTDLLLSDVHEWHGNTPIVGIEGLHERVSCVFYYREKMQECGSAEEELERAKNKKLAHVKL